MSKYIKPDGQSPPHLRHSFCRHAPYKSHGEAATAWHMPEMEVRGCQRQQGDPKDQGHGHSPCSHPSQDPQGRESIAAMAPPLPRPHFGASSTHTASSQALSRQHTQGGQIPPHQIPKLHCYHGKFTNTHSPRTTLQAKNPKLLRCAKAQKTLKICLRCPKTAGPGGATAPALQPGERWALLPAEASPSAWIHTPTWLRTAAFATGTENPLWAEWHH